MRVSFAHCSRSFSVLTRTIETIQLVNVEGRTVGDAVRHAVRTESSVGLTEDDVDVAMGLVEAQIRDFHRRPGELLGEG